MEKSAHKAEDSECSSELRRVLRNRSYRRPFEDHRLTKRLFTPEIKRFLKSWLVRRRDNPYPSRDEKKGLAIQTGLTYIQICNWFANWRRKLKNSGTEAQESNTWGNLIKTYNTKAQGNVEQFSLCSDDSIWEEQNLSDAEGPSLSEVINATAMDHSYSAVPHQGNDRLTEDQTEQLMTKGHQLEEDKVPDGQVNNRYKNLIMRRYLTDLKTCQDISPPLSPQEPAADVQAQKHKMKRNRRPENHLVELTKWLESAAKFKPGTRSVKNITWHSRHSDIKKARQREAAANNGEHWSERKHQREELDAAEALTCLSSTFC